MCKTKYEALKVGDTLRIVDDLWYVATVDHTPGQGQYEGTFRDPLAKALERADSLTIGLLRMNSLEVK